MVADFHLVSAAFFCPRARRPRDEYVTELRSFLGRSVYGISLLAHVSRLGKTWPLFADASPDIRALPHGPRDLSLLVAWSEGGPVPPVCETSAGLVALPLLLVLQLGQYFRYLEAHDISHEEFLRQVQHAGGIHGFCGGAAAALSIACAKDEAEVVANAAVFLRVMMGVGAAMEAAGDWASTAPTTIVVRLKYEGQGEELLEHFPGTYISAVTEPKSISIVGPAQALARLALHAKELGLPVHMTDITGKSHNPENTNLARDILTLLVQHSELQLPTSAILRTTIRSNLNGEKLYREAIMEDMVMMMLASRCEWHSVLCRVAEDLKSSYHSAHGLVVFGMDDCVPLSPFHRLGVKVSKFEARSLSFVKQVGEMTEGTAPAFPGFPATAVAIIGASCRLPGANNLDEVWKLVSEQRDCHERILKSRFDSDESFRVYQSGGLNWMKNLYGNFIDVTSFDPTFFGINAKEAANMDPQQRLLLELSYEALDSSGYLATHVRERGDPVGCFIGASMVEYLDNTNAHPPTAYTSTGTIRGFLCGRLSYYYGWTGPSEVLDTACSSSLVAIHRACAALMMGECKIAIAGGVNAMTGINNFLDLGKAGFLSPTGQCKAFDISADGYCRAEGAGLVVLKPLKQAIGDGDNILGVIPSVATNQGGLSPSLTVPSSRALQSLYEELLVRAGLSASHVSYVEAHATGTQAGDPIEMESIRAVFRNPLRSTPIFVGSIKGNIGHCETAAGVAGVLKVLAMIKYGAIPPQANYDVLNPKIPPLEHDRLEIPRTLTNWNAPVRAALVNSYGAAGSNCALVCCEIPKDTASTDRATVNGPHLAGAMPLVVSAATVNTLISYARTIAKYLSQSKSGTSLADVAFTLNHRRKRHRFCLAVIATKLQDVIDSFASANTPLFECPDKPRSVVLVFGGQNDNQVSVSRTFFDACPAFRACIDSCDSEIVKLGYPSLYPAIFEGLPDSNALSQQCRLFAIQYACARCWIDAGLSVSGIIGHSLGELTALVISGVLSLANGIKLVASRAHMMDTKWGTDKGAMLAISATSSRVGALVTKVISRLPAANLGIACCNAPCSTVVAGASTSVDMAEQLLVSDAEFTGIRFQRLSTSHAFHSSLVEPILHGLDEIAATVEFNEPKLPLELCTPNPTPSIRHWSASRHAREPVYFNDAVRRLEQRLGSCVWLEAGLNTCAIPLVRKATMIDVSHTFQSVDIKARKDPCGTISDIVYAFWSHGISLKHWAFLATPPKQVWLPPYQFEQRSHGIKNIDRAMEAHKKLMEGIVMPPEHANSRPRQLVKLLKTTTANSTFVIDGQCERYQKIVGGHTVVGFSLCPASMYMECVVMAIQSLVSKSCHDDLLFKDMEFSAPLGLDPEREITIQIVGTASDTAWSFTVQSTLPGPTPRVTVHCAGKVALAQKTSLVSFARILGDPLERLIRSDSAEKLKFARVYGLFSRVVIYKPFLKGISSIILDGNEATATIQLAQDQPNRHDSTAWHRCDAALLDAFISVAGLLLNSSELVSSEQVMVAGAVERTIITVACSAESPGPWQVYARFTSDGACAISDVFVYDSQRKVVAMFGGVQFTRVQLSRLKTTLSAIDGSPIPNPIEPADKQFHSPSVAIDTVLNTPDTDLDSDRQSSPTKSEPVLRGNKEGRLRIILSEYIGMKDVEIPLHSMLVDLGIDSLSSLELASDIATKFGLIVDSFELGQMTLADLLPQLDRSSSAPTTSDSPPTVVHDVANIPAVPVQDSIGDDSDSRQSPSEPITFRKPFEALIEVESQFDVIASKRGFSNYWSRVAPSQNELLVAYILEAFGTIGVDVTSLPLGASIPQITHHPRYDRLIRRFWEILQCRGIVKIHQDGVVRGHATPTTKSPSELHQDFLLQHPQYAPEAYLMQLAGQRLAECLGGQQDPVSLMFGSQASAKIMEDYYHNSPMLSSLTDVLVEFVRALLRDVSSTREHPLRILEVGAGTGGTTSRLADALSGAGVACEYTFTDISPVLVAKARSKFAKYPWMNFTTLDLEQEVRHDFRSQFHIIISTNCVHATRNRATSCRRLKDALAECGILILSEVTQTIDWYDICFGLLDGWWHGTEYPLQPAPVWMDALSEACFASFGFSKGPSKESTTQQLLVGVTRGLNTGQSLPPSDVSFHVETMEYKEVDGIRIHADIYVPHTRTRSMPIALMIHGGGHMTLSRKYIRPAQTRHLLAHGFLPVSLDFRLCPEVNLIDGPMTDVRDGYQWAKDKLPLKLLERGVVVDSQRIVVIGWSTGGHLALSLAWTTLEAGIPPPTAILSFYAPVNFDSTDIYRDCGTTLSRPSVSVHQIIKTLPRKPITTYTPTRADENNRFWLQPGDVRSDLLISIFKDGMGLPLFLSGLPHDTNSSEIEMPSEDRIAAIDPLAQLRRDRYDTPTCLVHPTKDNIAPYSAAVRFANELKSRGVRHKFVSPEGVGHAFDVNLQQGTEEWERCVAPGYQFLFDSV